MRGVSPMNKDKNQVTKLINKYAESYIYKEEENNQLKKTIKDLKVTLKYHKDMLNTLMSDMNLDDKMKLVMNQKKEESEYMTQKIDSLNKEVKEWRDKVSNKLRIIQLIVLIKNTSLIYKLNYSLSVLLYTHTIYTYYKNH